MTKNRNSVETIRQAHDASLLGLGEGASLAEWLAQARKLKGWTRQQLADFVGVSQNTIAKYEQTGYKLVDGVPTPIAAMPTANKLARLCFALDVNPVVAMRLSENEATWMSISDEIYGSLDQWEVYFGMFDESQSFFTDDIANAQNQTRLMLDEFKTEFSTLLAEVKSAKTKGSEVEAPSPSNLAENENPEAGGTAFNNSQGDIDE